MKSTRPVPPPWRWWTWCDRAHRRAQRTASWPRLRSGFVVLCAETRGPCLRRTAPFAQELRERLAIGHGADHSLCSRLFDGAQQRRPVGMIGEHETAVETAAPAGATYGHCARGQAGFGIAEPAHPARTAGGQWRQNQLTAKRAFWGALRDQVRRQHGDPRLAIAHGRRFDGTVDEYRAVGQQRQFGQYALGFSERVAEEHAGPTGAAIGVPPRQDLLGHTRN